MRSDAERNYARILSAAKTIVAKQGAQASLRDVARRAEVGMGTLYRHFPTREALLETLLRDRFEALAAKAAALESARDPFAALAEWLREFLSWTPFRGLASALMATLSDQESALHASCHAMRQAVGRLLARAQESGQVRPEVDSLDLFALVNAVGWVSEQAPDLAARQERLLGFVLDGLASQQDDADSRECR
ncbi:TetR/AcrR family transcriptional regulator [Nonomuraea terrae]|uniref:TetR/AcrR family transcriptional regulator n=1 Tax=Nonomuraea terrae TaxID=2530383 RepID=A0A4R4Z2C3_9ACTN|nr:TetR/AcrR family transcriptional regulator [Nonomuraea terrae]TDD52043.1 TetR/AcrR family transcriptional regulator [Nonomuraea terrae]